jgi:septal ring factor EnvC (AmiA/AmiB activator)
LTFSFYNVTPFHSLDFNISYSYLIFWASFRPTLWIGTIVVVVCAAVLFWRLPKRPEAVLITSVPSKDLRNFVDAYEKKTSILSELMSMEQQLQKGKIPRRKYKVRRETLEGRLSLLSRDLTDLKEKLRRSGARYASFVGQIEVTETELEGLETDIKRVEGRYRRGEISKGAYLRLLEEYHRRRERARVTIDGVLLRLKEEIR